MAANKCLRWKSTHRLGILLAVMYMMVKSGNICAILMLTKPYATAYATAYAKRYGTACEKRYGKPYGTAYAKLCLKAY